MSCAFDVIVGALDKWISVFLRIFMDTEDRNMCGFCMEFGCGCWAQRVFADTSWNNKISGRFASPTTIFLFDFSFIVTGQSTGAVGWCAQR